MINDKVVYLSLFGCLLLWAGIIGDVLVQGRIGEENAMRYDSLMHGLKVQPKQDLKAPTSDLNTFIVLSPTNGESINRGQRKQPLESEPKAMPFKLIFVKEEKNKRY